MFKAPVPERRSRAQVPERLSQAQVFEAMEKLTSSAATESEATKTENSEESVLRVSGGIGLTSWEEGERS